MTHEEAMTLAEAVTRAGFSIFLSGAAHAAYEARARVDGTDLDWEANISIKGAAKSLERLRELIDLLHERDVAASLQDDYVHVV